MFQRRTVFVLGAGSSAEVGLPIGSELAKDIEHRLRFRFRQPYNQVTSGDAEIARLVIQSFDPTREANDYINGGQRISNGLPLCNSIDTFLHMHKNDKHVQLCGKLAIVKSILEAEKKSQLYIDRTKPDAQLDVTKVEKSWFYHFFRLLNGGVTKENVDQIFRQVSFISFNYDRCSEAFLVEGLRAAYAMSYKESEALVREVSIFHPYGTVGSLPWQDGRVSVPYGGEHDLMQLSSGIKTFTERVEEGHELTAMRKQIQAADTIVFLGFGFHTQNLELLTPKEHAQVKRVFATAKGIFDPDIAPIKQQINAMLKGWQGPISIRNDINCADLLLQYRVHLALA